MVLLRRVWVVRVAALMRSPRRGREGGAGVVGVVVAMVRWACLLEMVAVLEGEKGEVVEGGGRGGEVEGLVEGVSDGECVTWDWECCGRRGTRKTRQSGMSRLR